MKKYFLLFSAGATITLASCGGDSNTAEQTINVDSLAQVKVDSIAAVEKAKTDSLIAATAKATADSIEAVRIADSIAKASKAPAKRTTSSSKKSTNKTAINTEVVATPPPQSIGNGKPKMTEEKQNNTIGDGKPKL